VGVRVGVEVACVVPKQMLSICKVIDPDWLLHWNWNAVATAKAAALVVVLPKVWSKLPTDNVTEVQEVGTTKLDPQLLSTEVVTALLTTLNRTLAAAELVVRISKRR
jgi:hypothetical protein